MTCFLPLINLYLITVLDKPGYNEYGQLGKGIMCKGLQGARIINAFAKFRDESPELLKITQVSCREYHKAAIAENGKV